MFRLATMAKPNTRDQPMTRAGKSTHVVFDLEETAVFEIILDDDVGDGVKDKLHVGRVGSASKVRVDLFCVLLLV